MPSALKGGRITQHGPDCYTFSPKGQMIAKYSPGLVISKHDPRPVTIPLALKGLRITKHGLEPVATPSAQRGEGLLSMALGRSLVSMVLGQLLYLRPSKG